MFTRYFVIRVDGCCEARGLFVHRLNRNSTTSGLLVMGARNGRPASRANVGRGGEESPLTSNFLKFPPVREQGWMDGERVL